MSQHGIISFLLLLALAVPLRAAPKPELGLLLTFTADASGQDTTTTPGVTLFVQAGQSPTPFLPAGKFTAVWEGALHADLRGNFLFQAHLNGRLTLEINGAVVSELMATNGLTPLTKSVQLNKGPNPFKATFLSPEQGDACVRLEWTEKAPFTGPIPIAAFTHSSTPASERAAQRRLGRELFLEHRCLQCHTDPVVQTGLPELNRDAPGFEGIGARRHYAWLAQWILDPKSFRPTAQMPRTLAGPQAKQEADAIAAYLASLKHSADVSPNPVAYRTRQTDAKNDEEPPADAGELKPLYERLHCIGCHNPPDATQPDPAKLSQKRIAEKFPPGKLAEYLRAPQAHYAWTRMPDFHLSDAEAKELEAWLFAAAPKQAPSTGSGQAPTDPALLETGRKLVQSTGCLNCHNLKLENRFTAPKLAELAPSRWTEGCLASEPKPGGKAPVFGFSPTARAALEAFSKADRRALTRDVPAEFAERHTRNLNCAACHGQLEGFPPLELLGSKLKPEWSARFIAGQIPHKVRYDAHPKGEPWLAARMPAFPSRAAGLATGLAARDGYPPITPAETPVDHTLAEAGRKLVGKDGGFSCVSCHGVGPLLAMEVFESEGINLVYSADRLQPGFYRRWLRAPSSVDPQTKMPVYFDEGRSPLTEILGGDGEKQIQAVWEYIRLRDKMSAPVTGIE